jgi:hypothetical protein
MEMSNKDEDNEIDVTFKKIDEDTEEEEEAPETLQIVEERVVSIDPSSVIQEGEGEDMDGEDEDILTDTNVDDDISEQQLKEQSVQIEKLAQGVHTLQMHYDEIQDQFKSINDLQSQVKKLQVQIDDIIKTTSNSKKRKVRKVKSKKASASATKKIGKRNKKQRR